MSIMNKGMIIGRVAKEITTFTNNDKSTKHMVTVAVEENAKTAKGDKIVNFVNLEALVPAGEKKGPFPYMQKGKLVAIEFSVRSNTYEKDGKKEYKQVLFIEDVKLLEHTKQQKSATAQAAEQIENTEENIPF